MVGEGISMIEGFHGTIDTKKGVALLKEASSNGHPQGHYELGVLYYTGAADADLPEDEKKAFDLFVEAAEAGELSYAEFMIADMLIEKILAKQVNEGQVDEELARAIGFLHKAAEKGHRFARAQVLKMLEDRHEVQQQGGAVEKEWAEDSI